MIWSPTINNYKGTRLLPFASCKLAHITLQLNQALHTCIRTLICLANNAQYTVCSMHMYMCSSIQTAACKLLRSRPADSNLWLRLGRGATLESGVEVAVLRPRPVSLAVKDLPALTGSATTSLEVRLVSASVRMLLTSALPLLLTTSLTAAYNCMQGQHGMSGVVHSVKSTGNKQLIGKSGFCLCHDAAHTCTAIAADHKFDGSIKLHAGSTESVRCCCSEELRRENDCCSSPSS